MSIYDELYEICKGFDPGVEFEPFTYNLLKVKAFYKGNIIPDLDKINRLLQFLWNNQIEQIVYTPSGSIAKHNLFHAVAAYSIEERRTVKNVFKGIKVNVIVKGTLFRFVFGYNSNEKSITGLNAYKAFLKECEKHNIDIDKYRIDDGEIVKSTIESPIIKAYYTHKEYTNVHHLDLNQAWPSEVCKVYPELLPVFQALRDKDKYYANAALGFMQSEYCKYSLANLSQAGINGCNKVIIDYMAKLWSTGHTIIGVNTDGIWYQGDVYHDENEGVELGQWKNDHTDCIIYYHSSGIYYFIEDGKFNVKWRGPSDYDKVKPREDWTKEDFMYALLHKTELEYIDKVGFITCQRN